LTATDRLVAALREHDSCPRQSGGSWAARCPAHEDHNPSLSVRQIEGQALVHCHADCPTEDVVAALGLTMSDLFDEPGVGAKYTYTNRSGQAMRYVHRSPIKSFRQSGETKGQPELYRLPAVINAVNNSTSIYVVEGEKDVHALESVDAVATTAPMGASNFGKVDVTPLNGAHVVVVPDQDKAGQRWLRDVLAAIEGVAATVKVMKPLVGKDAADHVAAGHGLDELVPVEAPARTGHRTVTVTAASSITIRPVRWLWENRVALGSLALLGGREGIGKSTVGYTLAADVTRGRMVGSYDGIPKSVIVAATEDSWGHTIVPRLMAAGADLDRVYRVDVTTPEGVDTGLVLPSDLIDLEDAIREVDAALILLDPLLSRLDASLDTHKDAEVRLALEPLTALADRSGSAVLGLIHVNKSTSADPLTLLMGSRAFAAVARAVLFVMTDPEDEAIRLLGQPKNNLGRTDLVTLSFRIDSEKVADTPEGEVWTGKLHWTGERVQSIRDALEAAGETPDSRSATAEATDWLEDYLTNLGGTDDSASIKEAGRKAGHSLSTLKRARQRIKATTTSSGFPRRTFWTLQGTADQWDHDSQSSPGETEPTELTGPTGLTEDPVGSVGSVGPVGSVPARGEPTAEHQLFEVPRQAGEDAHLPASLLARPVGPRPAHRLCVHCGQPLKVDDPDRDICARCQLVRVASATRPAEDHR